MLLTHWCKHLTLCKLHKNKYPTAKPSPEVINFDCVLKRIIMILVVDVDYRDTTANAAALVFENFSDESPLSSYTKIIKNIAEYKPGEFYKRDP